MYIYIYIYIHTYIHIRHARPSYLLRLSLPRLLDSKFPGNPMWTWEFHPHDIKILFESKPLTSRILVRRLAVRHVCNSPTNRVGAKRKTPEGVFTHVHQQWFLSVPFLLASTGSHIHYTTLHYTTLHYTTLHYTTLHYTTLHYTTLHYTTLHYTTLHYTTHDHTYTHTHLHTNTHTRLHAPTHIHTCTHTDIYTRIHEYLCSYIHAYTYTWMHVYPNNQIRLCLAVRLI